MARKNAGLPIGKVVQFNAHDMLVSTNRQISGHCNYEGFEQALTRLRGTTVSNDGENRRRGCQRGIFGMIESADVLRKEPITGRMVAIEVVLSDFLFRAIESNQVLPIHRDFFRLRRRLIGGFTSWRASIAASSRNGRIGLELLKDKVAFSSNARKLRAHVRNLARTQHLPDYTVDIADDVVTSGPSKRG